MSDSNDVVIMGLRKKVDDLERKIDRIIRILLKEEEQPDAASPRMGQAAAAYASLERKG